MTPLLYRLYLRRLRRHVGRPEGFTDRQRAGFILLLMELMDAPEAELRNQAVRVVIEMDGANQRLDFAEHRAFERMGALPSGTQENPKGGAQ